MSKAKQTRIEVQGTSIAIVNRDNHDFISLTDIAKRKNPEHSDDVIRNWLRSRSTVEFLGIWERLNNPDFNPVEFDGIRIQTGLNSFILTAIRDHAPLEQLVVLTNLESLNSVLIRQNLPQSERLLKLNEIAITQMRSLLTDTNVKRLK